MSEAKKQQDRSQPDEGRPLIEWVFGLASTALVAVLIVYLGYQALFADARPAELLVSIERIDQLASGTLVTVAVTNRGDEAASAVIVHATTSDRSGDTLQKQIEFDYVAAGVARRGAFVFSGPVTADELRVEVGGYAEP